MELSRREFLRYNGLVVALIGFTGVTNPTSLNSQRKEKERKELLGNIVSSVINQKEEENQELNCAIDFYKHKWDDAKPGDHYVVGVVKRQEHGCLRISRSYFRDSMEFRDFTGKCDQNKEEFYWDSRNIIIVT